MNRFTTLFGPKHEARLRYKDGQYQVITAGDFVRCAVTQRPIPIDDLRYWSVDHQEAYASAEISVQRYRELRERKSKRS